MLILVALWSRLLHLLPSLRTQRQQQQRQQQGLRLDVVPAPGLRHHLQGLPLGGQKWLCKGTVKNIEREEIK